MPPQSLCRGQGPSRVLWSSSHTTRNDARSRAPRLAHRKIACQSSPADETTPSTRWVTTRRGFVGGLTCSLWASAQVVSPQHGLAFVEPESEGARPATIYTGASGSAVSIEQLTENALKKYGALVVGENHDDPQAHELEMLLLKNLAAQCRAEGRPLVFSLEMLNRDMQGTLDKYFADEISERDFLYACRDSGSLWPNYITDYRPLVNFCKEAGVRVVCANAPSFSLRVVGQEGPDGLQRLSAAERELLPSLPYPPASKAYRDKMAFINKESPHGFSDRLMEVQALWDASMAGSVLDAIKPGSGGSQPFCVHVCGRLHVEDRMGVLSQLDQSGRSVGCLLIYPSRGQISGLSPKEFKQLPISSRGGDFVALTDLNLARTFR